MASQRVQRSRNNLELLDWPSGWHALYLDYILLPDRYNLFVLRMYRNDDGDWEELEITPLSQPPELPEVMRPQETAQSEQTA